MLSRKLLSLFKSFSGLAVQEFDIFLIMKNKDIANMKCYVYTKENIIKEEQ